MRAPKYRSKELAPLDVTICCLALKTDHSKIIGKTRKMEIVKVRHAIAYFLVKERGYTLNAAAEALGRTCHTTVLNSISIIENTRNFGQDMVATLREEFEGRAQESIAA